MNKVILIGYSGHAYVVCDILLLSDYIIVGYSDKEEKTVNPFELTYLGKESSVNFTEEMTAFVAIGNNTIRKKVVDDLSVELINVIHPTAVIASKVDLSTGILISSNTTINTLAKIGNGAIINTGAIIEHECVIGDFAHIAPGAVLAGNVQVGNRSFIGANSAIKEGVIIGNDVIVGVGSVILNDVPDGVTIVGNPGRIIKENK